jgi:O-antigen ligase
VNRLIILVFAGFAVWLIRRDMARRDGISSSIWVPTIWVAILTSRSVSDWLGFGGGVDTLEGSPVDRLFFIAMIFASFWILSKRRIDWPRLARDNWPIILFYGYFLVSVVWADSPVSSFKRWFKDLGNIFVALVILTERNPMQALRAVFVRCAYVWIPLSIIFVRYIPEMGRRYSRSGGLEVTGVAQQKNALGAMVLVCGLILIWDWLERSRPDQVRQEKLERYFPAILLILGAYLLHLCDSKTSMLCLALGGGVLAAVRLRVLRRRIGALGIYALLAVVGFFALDWMFGIKNEIVASLGRDMTFTGRTEVWRELLAVNTDPIIGTGFCSFWSDQHYQSQLPNWVAYSAHNGYLEVYIDGGWIGVFILGMLLLATALRVNAQLAVKGNYALVRFAILIATLIGDFAESHFSRMTPLWFLFLLSALQLPGLGTSPVRARREKEPDDERVQADVADWPDSRPSYP